MSDSKDPKEDILPALAACVDVLERLVQDPTTLAKVDLELRNRLVIAAGRVSRPNRDEQRLMSRAVHQKKERARREADGAKLERTGIRKKRLDPVFITPPPLTLQAAEGGTSSGSPRLQEVDDAERTAFTEMNPVLSEARNCYVCKTPCDTVHFFYDSMCNACGDFNYAKRSQTADLRGRVAFISGARVKIGYQAAILLLRAGARVIVSTRFPRDAAARYAREVDYSVWKDRLTVYGLDLRHTPSVEALASHLTSTLDRLDFVIHNACQTVRRPSGFYQHLMDAERGPLTALPASVQAHLSEYETLREAATSQLAIADGAARSVGILASPELSQVPVTSQDLDAGPQLFPVGQLDADLQQIDQRGINSWRLALDQVGTVELLEVHLVNALAPFVLNGKLRALMCRERTGDKHIVNVSAMEGQFYRRFKTDKHPHTNMAKAALNMMTRTSAPDYARDGIFMNSVDTGWVTDEDPLYIAQRKTAETGFQPPLDIVDGAARIVDPIFDGLNTGVHHWGKFLKDYRPTSW